MDAHEFMKIPSLIRHFEEHIQEGPGLASMDIMEFVFLHYVDAEHSHAPEHEQLPYHEIHKCSHIFALFEPQLYFFIFLKMNWIEKTIYPFYAFSVEEVSSSFWQPPKITL